jgi:tetratricopeptide (TPR) repeat protein
MTLGRFTAAALVLVASRAGAQENASSTALFNEGQRLMARGAYAEACPKFERALAITPGVGTKFNLAECYERTGRLGSAVRLFREVEELTREVGQDERSRAAAERASALEPRAPRLVVNAPWVASAPAAVVRLDGRTLARQEIGTPLFVDLGAHEAIATLDGRETRRSTSIVSEGQRVAIDLEPPPAAPPTSPPSTPEPSEPPSIDRRVVGLVLGAAGSVGLGVGLFVTISAKDRYEDATRACGRACPHDDAVRANDARTAANVEPQRTSGV